MPLNADLDAYTALWADRARRAECKLLAQTMCGKYAALGTEFEGMTMEDIVVFVDVARGLGNNRAVQRAEVWLLANYTPPRITGSRVEEGRSR